VLVDLVGTLENGKVFIDTRAAGQPLAFQIGQTNKFIPEGVSQVNR
jgi:FKBP-type peptidyl-prolyl cis-trans isomerase